MKLKFEVVIIEMSLKHYRKPFFELLRKKLSKANVELVLIHGFPSKNEAKKNDEVKIAWARQIKNKCIRIDSRELYWQPCLRLLQRADLIIVDQASKLILNYVLFLSQILGIKKLCFWGHGKNLQEHNASRIGERFKRFMSRHVHWWFAYNDLSAGIIRSLGYPEEKITSVQNSIDTCHLVEIHQKITQLQLKEFKRKIGIKGDNVCLYAGGMYPEKRLDFLINASVHIKNAVPDFEIIFIGAGPDDILVKDAAAKEIWIHYVGPKFDEEKVPYFMLAKLFLMPGLVGLALLDSFAMETPLITTNIPYHSPEIGYLLDGINGIIVQEPNDPVVYADKVSYLLKNNEAREKLISGCRITREKYTIEEMVERFAQGVVKALHS